MMNMNPFATSMVPGGIGRELGPVSNILRADVRECDDCFCVDVDLPGVPVQDISLEVNEHTLCIRGKTCTDTESSDDTYHSRERITGSVNRTIALPPGANQHEATSTLANGVLTVRFPKMHTQNRGTRKLKIEETSSTSSANAKGKRSA